MNQNPGQNNRPRQPYDPKREAARRAYLRKKRKRIRRNRIILGTIAIVILILLIWLMVTIVRMIALGMQSGSHETAPSDTQTADTAVQTESVGEAAISEPTPETTAPETAETYELNFKADLSAYEEYMNPTDRDAYLILVNAANPLSADDIPTDLVEVVNTRKDGRATQTMREYAEKALEALFIEAEAEGLLTTQTPSGYPLSVTSAYRSYAYQMELFSGYTSSEMANNSSLTQAEAEKIVETYSCRAGTSEHQTGLCCDMHTLTGADQSFANYEIAAWLEENAWKFGYILRFPEDKVNETGISYEPWHFRYVGRYHAYRMHKNNYCLEEYCALLK